MRSCSAILNTISKKKGRFQNAVIQKKFHSSYVRFVIESVILKESAVFLVIFFNIVRIEKHHELNQCPAQIQYTPKNLGCC